MSHNSSELRLLISGLESRILYFSKQITLRVAFWPNHNLARSRILQRSSAPLLPSFHLTFAYLSSFKACSVNCLAEPLLKVMCLASTTVKGETGPAHNLFFLSQRTIPNAIIGLLPTEVELRDLLLQSPSLATTGELKHTHQTRCAVH